MSGIWLVPVPTALNAAVPRPRFDLAVAKSVRSDRLFADFRYPVNEAKAFTTNAVVAIEVSLSPAAGVGAFGSPVNVGLARGAAPIKDSRLSHPVEDELGLLVLASTVLIKIFVPASFSKTAPFGYPPIAVENVASKVFSAPALDQRASDDSSYRIWFISWPLGGNPPAAFKIIVTGGKPASYDAVLSPAGVVASKSSRCPFTPNGTACFLGESVLFIN